MNLDPGALISGLPAEHWRLVDRDYIVGDRPLVARVITTYPGLAVTSAPDSWGPPGQVWWCAEVLPEHMPRCLVFVRHGAVAELAEIEEVDDEADVCP